MKIISITLLILTFFVPLTFFAQWSDDFSDPVIHQWKGDTIDFRVNEDGILQLNSKLAGESYIFRSSVFEDSLIWEMDIELQFSPSANNRLKIYLASRAIDSLNITGYYLEIGETGNADKIKLVYCDGLQDSLIAVGETELSTKFTVTLRVQFEGGNWKLDLFDPLRNDWINEFLVSHDTEPEEGLNEFGLLCKYTVSNADAFLFDNIQVSKVQPDIFPPTLSFVEVISPQSLVLDFNEPINVKSATEILIEANGESIVWDSMRLISDKIELFLLDQLDHYHEYSLTVSGICDTQGNISELQNSVFVFPVDPERSDVLINEILFDPYPASYDFVEIINATDKFIELTDILIRNSQNDQYVHIDTNLILAPKEIFAITEEPEDLRMLYLPPDSASIFKNDLPSFNNDQGNVSLLVQTYGIDNLIDSFDYRNSMHLALLDYTEGVSLERISILSETNDSNNWFSAAHSNNYATPGYANSAEKPLLTNTENIFFSSKVFSPDSDGYQDFLQLNYELPFQGYIANVSVYTDKGAFIKQIATNELLATKGFITWDGTNSMGSISTLGMYVVSYEFLGPKGEKLRGNKVCVLAQKLK